MDRPRLRRPRSGGAGTSAIRSIATRLILGLWLVAALLAALCALPAFAEDWTIAYSRVLAQMKTDDPNPLRDECYLYDINGDTIPELLIPTGTCEADSALRIYTMRNGAAVWVATLGFSHSVACGLSAKTRRR